MVARGHAKDVKAVVLNMETAALRCFCAAAGTNKLSHFNYFVIFFVLKLLSVLDFRSLLVPLCRLQLVDPAA
jgi:hypothetical protein